MMVLVEEETHTHTLCYYQKIKKKSIFGLPLSLKFDNDPTFMTKVSPKSGKGPKCSLKIILCLEMQNLGREK